jgi:hypothetical protein
MAPARAKPAEPAPAMRLPDLAGKTVDLAGFRRKETMLLFWNPGCGFCQQMVDDVKALERHRAGSVEGSAASPSQLILPSERLRSCRSPLT